MASFCVFSSSRMIPPDEEPLLLLLRLDELLPVEEVVELLPALGCRSELLDELPPVELLAAVLLPEELLVVGLVVAFFSSLFALMIGDGTSSRYCASLVRSSFGKVWISGSSGAPDFTFLIPTGGVRDFSRARLPPAASLLVIDCGVSRSNVVVVISSV